MPPKPPLLITSTWSPARASRAIASTSAVEIVVTTDLGAQRRERRGRIPAEIAGVAEDAIGRARLSGSASFIVPSFIVFERGSSTARMRALPTLRRRPSSVVAIAVG